MPNNNRITLLSATLLALSSLVGNQGVVLAGMNSDGTYSQTINVTATGGGPFSIGSQAQSDSTTVPLSVDPSQDNKQPPAEGAGTEASSGCGASSGQDVLGGPTSHFPAPVFGAPVAGGKQSNADFVQNWVTDSANEALNKKMQDMKDAILKRLNELGGCGGDQTQALQNKLQQLQQINQQNEQAQSQANQLLQQLIYMGIMAETKAGNPKNDQAIQNAIDSSPDTPSPTPTPDDDPNSQMDQAYKNGDYNKIRDLAPKVAGGDPNEISRNLTDARNAALNIATDNTKTPQQRQDAIDFMGKVLNDYNRMASQNDQKDPKTAAALRGLANETGVLLNQAKDSLNK